LVAPSLHNTTFHRAWGVSCRAAAKRGEAGPGCRSGCARLAPQDGGDLHIAPITTAGGLDAAGGQRRLTGCGGEARAAKLDAAALSGR
jgi:hypothetical protein